MSSYPSRSFQKFSRVCNFRASTLEQYEEWLKFKDYCKNQGLDICHVVISLITAWNKAQDGLAAAVDITTFPNLISLQMENQFIYQPLRARREPPPSLIRSKRPFARIISSKAAELYILWKVSDLKRSFSYLDLAELPPNYVRKEILRLKKRGLVKPLPPRTRPRFYVPTVRLHLEPINPYLLENNKVKHLFSPPDGGECPRGGGL